MHVLSTSACCTSSSIQSWRRYLTMYNKHYTYKLCSCMLTYAWNQAVLQCHILCMFAVLDCIHMHHIVYICLVLRISSDVSTANYQRRKQHLSGIQHVLLFGIETILVHQICNNLIYLQTTLCGPLVWKICEKFHPSYQIFECVDDYLNSEIVLWNK